MSISNDYMRWGSEIIQAFFEPAMSIIRPDAAIKKIDCSVWFKGSTEVDRKCRIKQKYDLLEVPPDDRAFFCDLPFESKIAQDALTMIRKEIQVPPIEKIKNAYFESLQGVKELGNTGQNVEMIRIKIKVVFASKSDLQNDQTFRLEVGQKTKGHTL